MAGGGGGTINPFSTVVLDAGELLFYAQVALARANNPPPQYPSDKWLVGPREIWTL
jgi:hypothetical protein